MNEFFKMAENCFCCVLKKYLSIYFKCNVIRYDLGNEQVFIILIAKFIVTENDICRARNSNLFKNLKDFSTDKKNGRAEKT